MLVSAANFLLVLLWVYAATSKLIDFERFKWEIRNQVLYPFLKVALIYLLPPSELIIAGLLCSKRTQQWGIYLSLFLLAVFTAYIALIISHVFSRVPCSCGGILEHLGWWPHLFFNLFFLILTSATIWALKRKELSDKK